MTRERSDKTSAEMLTMFEDIFTVCAFFKAYLSPIFYRLAVIKIKEAIYLIDVQSFDH
jgi:hypothetical protein